MRPTLVGLVGTGVGPSLTPALHMREARHHGLDYVYRTLDLDRRWARAGAGRASCWPGPGGSGTTPSTSPTRASSWCSTTSTTSRTGRPGSARSTPWSSTPTAAPSATTPTPPASPPRCATGLPEATTAEVVQLGAGGAGAAVADALLAGATDRLVLVDVDPRPQRGAGPRARATGSPRPGSRRAHPDKLPALLTREVDGLVHCTPTGMADHPGLPLDAGAAPPRPVGGRHRLPAAGHAAGAGGARGRLPRRSTEATWRSTRPSTPSG